MSEQPQVCDCAGPTMCRRMDPSYVGPCQLGQRVVGTLPRQQGKTLALARKRVRKVAEGGMINTTYGLPVGESLAAFRADLLFLLKALP